MLAAIVAIALGISLASFLFAFVTATPYIGYFSGTSALMTGISWISGLAMISSVILLIMFLIFRIFTQYKLKKSIRQGLLGTALISMVLFAFTMFMQIPNYANQSSLKTSNEYTIDNDVIYFNEILNEGMEDGMILNFANTQVNRKGLFCDNISVNLYKSKNDNILIEKEIKSCGRTKAQAKKLASHIVIEEQVSENGILIPDVYQIEKGNKYRGQYVRYKIYIPEYKKVDVADELHWVVRINEFDEDEKKQKRKKNNIKQEIKKETDALKRELQDEKNAIKQELQEIKEEIKEEIEEIEEEIEEGIEEINQ